MPAGCSHARALLRCPHAREAQHIHRAPRAHAAQADAPHTHATPPLDMAHAALRCAAPPACSTRHCHAHVLLAAPYSWPHRAAPTCTECCNLLLAVSTPRAFQGARLRPERHQLAAPAPAITSTCATCLFPPSGGQPPPQCLLVVQPGDVARTPEWRAYLLQQAKHAPVIGWSARPCMPLG